MIWIHRENTIFYVTSESIVEILNNGSNNYNTKSFDLELLKDLVDVVLRSIVNNDSKTDLLINSIILMIKVKCYTRVYQRIIRKIPNNMIDNMIKYSESEGPIKFI